MTVGRRAFSVAVYARRAGTVLVIRHRRLSTWLPVGGEIEPGETPLEAAVRELHEETGLTGRFPPIARAPDGVPPGLIGYEEHQAGSKGLHMNFVFVADVEASAAIAPNAEFDEWRWVDDAELDDLDSPVNVRQFGYLALAAREAQPEAGERLLRNPLQQISAARDAALAVIGGGGILGGGPPPPDRIEQHEVLIAVAGGSGRLVVAGARAEYTIPGQICNSCVVTHRLLDGTGSIAVVTLEGKLSFVTVSEAAPTVVAVDAYGVVWATASAIRAANR